VHGSSRRMPVMFLESKRAITHIPQVWINTVRCEHARAISSGEERGPTWPLGTHYGDGGDWNAWVCASANHARPTSGTRRELGSEISRNEELVNTYRQTPQKSPHEVSRIRRVSLGTAAQLCRSNAEVKIIKLKIVCAFLNSGVGAFDAYLKDTSNGTCLENF
jgi:hypothetical protein